MQHWHMAKSIIISLGGGLGHLGHFGCFDCLPISTSSTVLEVLVAWEMAPPMRAPIPSLMTTAASSADLKGGSLTAV